MTHQPPLFHELAFTKENVLTWAEERSLDEPVLRMEGQDVANSATLVLQSVLMDHYVREWTDMDRGELIGELLTYVAKGVDSPLDTMNSHELLDELMEVCKEAYEFETMDDFVGCFGGAD